MATEQDYVWAMLDDMLVFLSKRHVPTPERTYKLDGGWTLAMDDLRRFVDELIAERDRLRAELAAKDVEAKEYIDYRNAAVLSRNAMEKQRDAALAAELAEAREQITAERNGWKIALRALLGEPEHAAIIGNPASPARAEIDEIGAKLVELAEARRDGERLDWLIRNHEIVNTDGWYDHADKDALDEDEDAESLKAWRKYLDEEIDAARGGEK